MTAEFLRDDNNNVWFSYAKNIHIKRLKPKQISNAFDSENITDKFDEIKNFQTKILLNELEEFQTSVD